MMKKYLPRFFGRLVALGLVLALQVGAGFLEANSVRLSGHVPTKALSHSKFLARVAPGAEIALTFTLPLRNQEELEELVRRMYDPSDVEHYGKYLTLDEFAERFAPTDEDYEQVAAYVESLGLKVTGSHANRLLLNVSGSSEVLEKAFNLQLHHYQKPCGRIFHAPNDDPEVPSFIASLIHGIVGLDSYAIRHTYNRRKEKKAAAATSHAGSQMYPSGPNGGYAPKDILTAYHLNGISADGSSQIIALFELGGYQESDIQEYASQFGLPSPQLINILVDGGSADGINAEVTLDIELALALAPKSQIYIYEGPNSDRGVLDTYNRIATDNLAKQVSTSWGMGEDMSNVHYLQAENAIFLQMAAHGQSIYAAAGDSGAYDDYDRNQKTSLVVDDPASQPYVVSVGGTRLSVNPNSGAYGSETVWNDGLGNGAGGGGISSVWPIPSWQQNVSTVGSTTHRNVPDVALNADSETGYAIYYDGQWTIYGGTSCAAPLWAAFTALVNQEREANQLASLGFANPTLYSLALGPAYSQNFHDITTGSNLYYHAQTGYDNASGWGSFNGVNLFNSLTSSQPVSPPPPPPQLAPAFSITMTPSGSFAKRRTGVYNIVVHNQGSAPTSEAVSVVLSLPQGLTYRTFQGTGWTFNKNTMTCTRSCPLQPGASYPPITLTVNVLNQAHGSLTSTATVSGGGAASSASVSTPTPIH